MDTYTIVCRQTHLPPHGSACHSALFSKKHTSSYQYDEILFIFVHKARTMPEKFRKQHKPTLMKPIKTALLALPLLAAGCNGYVRVLQKSGRWWPEASGVEDALLEPRYEKMGNTSPSATCSTSSKGTTAHFACGVDAFENFDLVASGARDIGRHAGPLGTTGWCTRRSGGSPTCWHNVRPVLKARVDGYIARIEAAQKSDPDGSSAPTPS